VCNKNKVSKLALVSKLEKHDDTGRLPLISWLVFIYTFPFAEKLVIIAISISLQQQSPWMQ
jgi:hypothetical protein